VSGVVVLVTMTMSSDDMKSTSTSSFAMRFVRSRNDTVFPSFQTLYHSSFVTGEGRQVASFPKNNAVDYKYNASHLMVISRTSGDEFNLTQTFLDIESFGGNYYWIHGMQDEAERTRFITTNVYAKSLQ